MIKKTCLLSIAILTSSVILGKLLLFWIIQGDWTYKHFNPNVSFSLRIGESNNPLYELYSIQLGFNGRVRFCSIFSLPNGYPSVFMVVKNKTIGRWYLRIINGDQWSNFSKTFTQNVSSYSFQLQSL